jgi:hypothetical protein
VFERRKRKVEGKAPLLVMYFEFINLIISTVDYNISYVEVVLRFYVAKMVERARRVAYRSYYEKKELGERGYCCQNMIEVVGGGTMAFFHPAV